MPKIPILDKCCFCVELELGCKIIAWCECVFAIIGLIAAIGGTVGANTGRGAGVFLIIITILYLILGFCLLFGIYKQRPNLIKIWIIAQAVAIVLNIINFIVYLFSLSAQMTSSIIAIIIGTYFLLVVYSYHKLVTSPTTPTPTV